MPSALELELAAVLNRYSQENGSNTPDFILAQYLLACLAAFNAASRAREQWYGKALSIEGSVTSLPQAENPGPPRPGVA